MNLLVDYIAVGLFALVGTLLLSSLVLRAFPKWKLMDNPKKFGFTRKAVPYSAGLILYVIFLLGALLFLDGNLKLVGVITGVSVLVATSFIDDRIGLSPYLRLLVQVAVVGMIVATGSFIFGFNVPLFGWVEFGAVWGRLATAVWLLLLINVVNWLDGVPGLAPGVSGIGFLTIFVLAALPHFHTLPQEGVMVFSLLLGVASLVVTFFCWPRLRYLLGDSGSMFLGLMLGVASVYSGGKVATAALVLFLPIFDAIWTILRRLWRGKSPFKGDLHHLHHRIQRVGLSNKKMVLLYLCFSLVVAVLALLVLSTSLKGFLALVLFAILFVVSVVVVYLETVYGSKGGNKRSSVDL